MILIANFEVEVVAKGAAAGANGANDSVGVNFIADFDTDTRKMSIKGVVVVLVVNDDRVAVAKG